MTNADIADDQYLEKYSIYTMSTKQSHRVFSMILVRNKEMFFK